MTRLGVLTTVALVTVACGGDTKAADSTVAVAQLPPVARPLTPSDSACPKDGTWKGCALEDRINKAGIPIKVLDTIRVPYFAEPGVRYRIGRVATMAAFYFPDSAAGAKATEKLHRIRMTPPDDSIGAWPAPPFEGVRSANLIAVLFDVNGTQAERVRLAITAGAPQPASAMPPVPSGAQKLPPAPPAR
ncbi:MAG TPA: hypothetical protein VGE27_01410 [Gemmatimonas sp.]|uniref:hypothetical protein n=1 Tax=Gemmatimonas sp. TaxID=1962908 RepID=UPI002EDABE1F